MIGQEWGNSLPAKENNFMQLSNWFANCCNGHTVAQQQNIYKSLKRNMRCCISHLQHANKNAKNQSFGIWMQCTAGLLFSLFFVFGCMHSDKLQKIYKSQLICFFTLGCCQTQMSGTNMVACGCHTQSSWLIVSASFLSERVKTRNQEEAGYLMSIDKNKTWGRSSSS